MIGITKDGRWLSYEGPINLIRTGEWQALAESKQQSQQALLTAGYYCKGRKDNKIDVIFPVFYGCNGEDGQSGGF